MLVLQPERHILGLTVLLTVGQPQELHRSWEGEKSNQTFRIYLLAPRSHNSHSGRAAPASSNKAAQRYQKNVMEELFLPNVCSMLPGYISLFCRLWKNLVVLKLNGETAELLEEIKKGSYIFLRYFLVVPYNTFCFLI